MELLDIIKQTLFLILLIGFGVLSLSYSIYRIKARNKSKPDLQIASPPKKIVIKPLKLPDNVLDIYEHSLNRKTSERFIVINNITPSDTTGESKDNKNTNGYKLHSINNTGMYKLKFD